MDVENWDLTLNVSSPHLATLHPTRDLKPSPFLLVPREPERFSLQDPGRRRGSPPPRPQLPGSWLL